MLLSITTTHRPATDLGYLLHKNPGRVHELRLSFGKAFVFYPEATDSTCTAVLLLEVDPVGIVRGRPGAADGGLLDQYVNDRSYVASSFLSVAIAEAFRSALGGRSKERPELATTPIPLKVRIPALPCRGGEPFLRRLFEPLGYTVIATRHPLDDAFPEWGDGVCFGVDLERTGLVSETLTHLYVLIPVLDGGKHYYIGDDEVRKLLERGKGWLRSHPDREAIARRYLKRRPSLARLALARLEDEDGVAEAAEEGVEGEPDATEAAGDGEAPRAEAEESPRLNDVRIGSVVSALRASGASTVLDLGCGEGRLLGELLREPSLTRVVGMDVSVRALEIAARRLRLDRLPPRQRARIELLHGSLTYRDARLAGFDAATVVEVIEHLDPPRLAAFERVLFEFARPGTIVLTTPNREYNVVYDGERTAREAVRARSAELPPPQAPPDGSVTEAAADPADAVYGRRLRHPDHRFEWTRAEFREWAERTASRFAYSVSILSVGPEEPGLGAPTQMAVFRRNAAPEGRPG